MMVENFAFIGLGSNIGDRIINVKKAIEKIDDDILCSVKKISSFYESKAFGYTEQPDFINVVIRISTGYPPDSLFHLLKGIEKEIGRVKTTKWGPRKIDLDILFYNDWIYKNRVIQIPHKGISERDFVLLPMSEIEPDYIHPELNKKISDICTSIKTKTIIDKLQYEVTVK
jgi:2-amino-4-hydroxy-6-hydroxymethyldihydropteridine diphosphokinase